EQRMLVDRGGAVSGNGVEPVAPALEGVGGQRHPSRSSLTRDLGPVDTGAARPRPSQRVEKHATLWGSRTQYRHHDLRGRESFLHAFLLMGPQAVMGHRAEH